jgi:peroxiredoxin
MRSPALPLRSCFAALLLTTVPLQAQRISGRFVMDQPPGQVVLFDTKGAEHAPVDSVPVRTGAFYFPERKWPAGFYQLAVNDTDRVDIILHPSETSVELEFEGRPLQEHISIRRSNENRILWEYKWISRANQQRVREIRAQRAEASPLDHALLMQLDSAERKAMDDKESRLDDLLQRHPDSYFAKVVKTDRALMAAVPTGWTGIAKAFAWADPELLRSSIYSKAVMAALQNAPQDRMDVFERASDSLLMWTRPDEECWSYTRSLLVRLFAQYGPDHVAQYVVDTFVSGPGSLVPAGPEVLEAAADLLKVTVGARVPEVRLPDPLTGDTLDLHAVLERNDYTCLFFYSSTCDHCHAQMPGLRELYAERKGRGFEVIGIALDADTAEFAGTLRAEQLSWPSYSELCGWGSLAAKAFVVKSTPSFFLVDRNGIIRAKPLDHEELRLLLARLLP